MTSIPWTRGGWWHDYVCPAHGTELCPATGDGHACSHGCVLTGEPYDSAWVVLEHQARARELRLCARRYRVRRDRGDLERALELLAAYGRLYREVETAGWSDRAEAWMLRGKLFSQALTEALWAVQVADAVTVLAAEPAARDRLETSAVELLRGLRATVTEGRRVLIDDRGELRSNYTAWLDCAGSAVARALSALGEPEDPQPWTKAGFEHLRAAVGDDGWEWEAATYYHVFVLRAHLLALRGVDPAALPVDVSARLGAMVGVLTSLAAPGGDVPVLHDGPYRRDGALLELIEVCVLARQLWVAPGVEKVEAYARAALAQPHDGLEDLLDGWFAGPPLRSPRAERGSVRFGDAGILVLRDPDDTWQAVVDAGPHGGSHGHLDKLALYLYGTEEPWQPAPGVPPYGSGLRREHYARTLAHPTVRVDGADQQPCTGRIETWEAGTITRAVVTADDAFGGITLRREVIMRGRYLLDVVQVRVVSGDERDIALGLRPGGSVGVRVTPAGWRTLWDTGGRPLHGIHTASCPAAMEVVPGRGPSDDPVIVSAADWTAHTSDAVTFASAYWPDDGDLIHAVELEPDFVRVHLSGTSVDDYPLEDR